MENANSSKVSWTGFHTGGSTQDAANCIWKLNVVSEGFCPGIEQAVVSGCGLWYFSELWEGRGSFLRASSKSSSGFPNVLELEKHSQMS